MTMTKNGYILIIFILAALLSACDAAKEKTVSLADAVAEKGEIAIIKTTEQAKDGALIFYDADLNEIGTKTMQYATLSDYFSKPFVYQNKLFLAPQGYGNSKEEDKILEIDLTTWQEKVYQIEQTGSNYCCANSDYIYSVSNLNGVTYLTRTSRADGSLKTVDFSDMIALYLICDENNVYVFGLIDDATAEYFYDSKIFVYDRALNLLNKVEDDTISFNTSNALITDDKVYFTCPLDKNDNEINVLSVLDRKSNQISQINLAQTLPWSIVKKDDILLISHFDIVTWQGAAGITFYDINSGESSYQALEHAVAQIELRDDKLYILGEDNLFKYQVDYNEKQLKLLKKVALTHADGYYICGLFAVKPK